ncbi:MAG TPA: hypothetical protein VJR71_03985 [Pseudolabrys sp.]|nr:hypothetical protein [Pseudolabrys sp.]
MTPEFRNAQNPTSEDLVWRHFWLKSVLVDSGKPMPPQRFRPTARKLTLQQRLRRLRRMRMALEE